MGMTFEDTASVLGKCAAYDQRTVGEADVLAWHEVIGHLDRESCLAAVTAHYREHSHRAMPADIRKLATDRRAQERGKRDRAERAALTSGATAHPRRTVLELRRVVSAALREAGPGLEPHQRGWIAEQACREWLQQTKPVHFGGPTEGEQ